MRPRVNIRGVSVDFYIKNIKTNSTGTGTNLPQHGEIYVNCAMICRRQSAPDLTPQTESTDGSTTPGNNTSVPNFFRAHDGSTAKVFPQSINWENYSNEINSNQWVVLYRHKAILCPYDNHGNRNLMHIKKYIPINRVFTWDSLTNTYGYNRIYFVWWVADCDIIDPDTEVANYAANFVTYFREVYT